MTGIRANAIEAGAAAILRRHPSLGDDGCRNLARDVLRAALPHLEDRESQDELAQKMRAAFAEYGLSPQQVAGVEGSCARLIEAAARRPYAVLPKQRQAPERSG